MKLIWFTFLFLYCKISLAQKTDAGLNPIVPYKKAIVVGGNYTYVWDNEVLNSVDYNTSYNEHTIAVNVALDFSKHFRVGVDYKRLFTKGALFGKNNYALLGAFTQYKFAQKKQNYFFGELGFYKGNYCTCGQDTPYSKEDLSYLSWGGGYNFKLYKNFKVDLAFTNAQVISKVNQRYAYTQYIIGLDYLLSLNSNRK